MSYLLGAMDVSEDLLETIFKGLGICILAELASQSCKDVGENAIALKAELAGKVALVLISMPLFSKLLKIISSLLSFG